MFSYTVVIKNVIFMYEIKISVWKFAKNWLCS